MHYHVGCCHILGSDYGAVHIRIVYADWQKVSSTLGREFFEGYLLVPEIKTRVFYMKSMVSTTRLLSFFCTKKYRQNQQWGMRGYLWFVGDEGMHVYSCFADTQPD